MLQPIGNLISYNTYQGWLKLIASHMDKYNDIMNQYFKTLDQII